MYFIKQNLCFLSDYDNTMSIVCILTLPDLLYMSVGFRLQNLVLPVKRLLEKMLICAFYLPKFLLESLVNPVCCCASQFKE